MKGVYLSLGSNYGDRRSNVENALLRMEEILKDVRKSEVYETKAVHGFGPAYFNAVIYGTTNLEYEELNMFLKGYEKECGRTPESKLRNEVVIDLDIVVWDNEIVRPTDFAREFFQIGYKKMQIGNE
ncbi:MAG: 2-amino-4-hydroxy-6-hydroxymethyldihydropteridine diphosphokinase [Muribaculaceae bacterium]|nr:2-amino-4-hydroxy-6-hydroxymethyldihydropteridine diphosphokinase [Muribaculaceae bacterium]